MDIDKIYERLKEEKKDLGPDEQAAKEKIREALKNYTLLKPLPASRKYEISDDLICFIIGYFIASKIYSDSQEKWDDMGIQTSRAYKEEAVLDLEDELQEDGYDLEYDYEETDPDELDPDDPDLYDDDIDNYDDYEFANDRFGFDTEPHDFDMDGFDDHFD